MALLTGGPALTGTEIVALQALERRIDDILKACPTLDLEDIAAWCVWLHAKRYAKEHIKDEVRHIRAHTSEYNNADAEVHRLCAESIAEYLRGYEQQYGTHLEKDSNGSSKIRRRIAIYWHATHVGVSLEGEEFMQRPVLSPEEQHALRFGPMPADECNNE